MHAISFIQDLAVIMLVAGVVTILFHRFKQPVVLGYIVAGFTGNPWISLVLGAVLIVVAVKILHKSNIGVKK